MSIETMKLAREVIQDYIDEYGPHEKDSGAAYSLIKLDQAIEQAQKQEPVAYTGNGTAGREADVKPTGFFFQADKKQEPVANYCRECLTYNGHHEGCSNYTAPPQRQWVDLTDDEEMDIALEHNKSRHWVVCEAIRQFKEKNT